MFKEFINLNFWQYSFLGNEVKSYVIAVIAFIVFIFVSKFFQSLILHHLKKLAKTTKTDIDDTLISIVQSLKPPFYSFVAIYLALYFITLATVLQEAINIILIAWVTYQVIIGVQILIDYAVKKASKKEEDKGSQAAMTLMGKIAKGILWVIGILLILSNLGVNITSLIAGLGIGGVAIALALQNILSDLFSSFAIYFDKPFVVGDYISLGEHKGSVERIGIKTTRLRGPQGEEISISNQELTSARVKNFKKMKERRIAFSFGVTYDILSEKLQQIPSMIKGIIESVELTRFDRTYFIEFGDSALLFEVVYFVQSPDYKTYRNIHQEILYKIKRTFEENKIIMAYPTQTIYLEKG
ncbi:mechanosensitive ion channel family protein [Patescibacteria group bacterium AH-259-L07]|nr:mechanosensitive ion channel family protein [Patescibacteria group bacterium AH-259-L07]